MQRFRMILVAISLVLSVGAQGAFAADSDMAESERRAVKKLNYGVSFGLGYLSANGGEAESTGSDPTLIYRRSSVVEWNVGGRATIPIGDYADRMITLMEDTTDRKLGWKKFRKGLGHVGARVFLDGGRFSNDADLTFESRRIQDEPEPLNLSFGTINLGSELFWRDPSLGHFGMGYGYSKVFDQLQTHSALVSAGLYVKNLDFTLDFRYDRDSTEPGSRSALNVDRVMPVVFPNPTVASNSVFVDGNGYSLDAGATWYLSELFAFTADVGWDRSGDPSILRTTVIGADIGMLYRSAFGAEFLTLAFTIGGGGQEYRVTGYDTLSQPFLKLTTTISFDVTTAESLMELFREHL